MIYFKRRKKENEHVQEEKRKIIWGKKKVASFKYETKRNFG